MQTPIIERVDYHGWILRREGLGGWWYVSRHPLFDAVFVSSEIEDAVQSWSRLTGKTARLEPCPTKLTGPVPDAWWVYTIRNSHFLRKGKVGTRNFNPKLLLSFSPETPRDLELRTLWERWSRKRYRKVGEFEVNLNPKGVTYVR